jgi:endonuclease/exonuclease/phosphatase family metal-dependent hydrolase
MIKSPKKASQVRLTRSLTTLAATATMMTLGAGLVVAATGCGLFDGDGRGSDGSAPGPRAQTRAPTPQGIKLRHVGMELRLDAAAPSLPRHDGIEVEVKYPGSSETAPYYGRRKETLAAGRSFVVGAVRALPKVVVAVNLYSGDALVAACETSALDLSASKDAKVKASLVCKAASDGSLDAKPVTVPVVAVTRATVDVGLEPEFRNAVDDLVARATDGLLFLNTRVTFVEAEATAGGPGVNRAARAELAFLPTSTPAQAAAATTAGTLALRLAEASSGAALSHFTAEDVTNETLRSLLSGETSVVVAGRVLAKVATGAAIDREYVDATLALTAKGPARIVTDGKGRAVSIALRGVFTSIDGSADAAAGVTPLELAFTLRDASSKAPAEITVGSYNVENMWDDTETVGVHYGEYADATSNWYADKMHLPKARSVAKAIALAGAPDILALEEIESAENRSRSLELLKPELAKLGYRYFELGHQQGDNPVAVTTALVSKFPIVQSFNLPFVYIDPAADAKLAGELAGSSRDPHVSEVVVAGRVLRVYSAHWKSKRSGEEAGDRMRLFTARLMKADMDAARAVSPDLDMVILGDFNTEYSDKAIVEGLRSTGDERRMLEAGPSDSLYNLWFELPESERGSYSFEGKRTTIDNILVNDALFDDRGFQIVDNSFRVVGHTGLPREILMNADGTPLRWQQERRKVADGPTVNTHLGVGYSDHLPLVFTLKLAQHTEAVAPGKDARDGKQGSGIATPARKVARVNPSTTHLPPATVAEDVVPVCTESEPVLDPRIDDVFLPQNFGRCVKLEGVKLPLRKVGQFDVGVVLEGEAGKGRTLVVSATRSFGANKGWIRGTLQVEAGAANLTFVKGRIGISGGRIAVLPHDTAKDVTLVPFVKCAQASDVVGTFEGLQPTDLEANKNACLTFEGVTVDVGTIPAPGNGVSDRLNVGSVILPALQSPLVLRMDAKQARALFPKPGRYVVTGRGVLDHFAARSEWQVNLVAYGRETGVITLAP